MIMFVRFAVLAKICLNSGKGGSSNFERGRLFFPFFILDMGGGKGFFKVLVVGR